MGELTPRKKRGGWYFQRPLTDPSAPDYRRPPLRRAFVSPLGTRLLVFVGAFVPLSAVLAAAGLERGELSVASYVPASCALLIYEHHWRRTNPPTADRPYRRFERVRTR